MFVCMYGSVCVDLSEEELLMPNRSHSCSGWITLWRCTWLHKSLPFSNIVDTVLYYPVYLFTVQKYAPLHICICSSAHSYQVFKGSLELLYELQLTVLLSSTVRINETHESKSICKSKIWRVWALTPGESFEILIFLLIWLSALINI